MKTPLQLVQRVLVCEYKDYNRAALRRILHRHGYAVTMTESLAQALKVFANRRAGTSQLLLVDVIPSENRMTWVSAVRQRQPQICVLATSAYLGDGFLPPASVAYLPKPFTSHELAAAAAAALAGRVGHALPTSPRIEIPRQFPTAA